MRLRMRPKKVVIHESTHNHYAEADSIIQEPIDNANNAQLLHITGKCLVTHGEHGTLRVDSKCAIKYTQQELDPITNNYQNVYD